MFGDARLAGAWLGAGLWLAFAIGFYIVGVVLFRVRTGRWPYAYPRPLAPYAIFDQSLGVVLTGYSAWVVFAPAPGPLLSWIGVAIGSVLMCAGAALRAWGLAGLGASWRMGQDDADESVSHVRTGAFALVGHPLNLALVIAAAGQLLLRGLDTGSTVLSLVAITYWLVQGVAEERHWRARSNPS